MNRRVLGGILSLLLLTFSFPSYALETAPPAAKEEQPSDDDLQQEEFLSFIRSQWDQNGLPDEETLKALIEEAEQSFDVSLSDDAKKQLETAVREQIADTVQKQVVEPMQQAAADAAKDTAKTFWSDLKTSVVSFLKNLFS